MIPPKYKAGFITGTFSYHREFSGKPALSGAVARLFSLYHLGSRNVLKPKEEEKSCS